MPTNTSGGTTTSFMNTPQATDNSYVAGEDAIYTFDVMADDLGGNAKVLWSIDDVNLNGTTTTSADGTTVATTSGDSVIDLTVKDAAGCVEKSQLGANIWIENGKVKYDSGPLDWLAAGQTAVDYFTYAIRLSNGTLSWATVQVTLTGTNDAPTISAADAAGAVTEDAAVVDGKLSDAGTITFDDVDLTDTHSVSQVTAAGTNALGGTLTASVTDAAAGVGGGTVTWNYSVANSAVQYLAQGQTATETFTVRIADISGGYVEQVIVVTVTGTNDAPAILVQDLTGAVVEDASSPNLADSGTLTFDDIDLTDTHSTSVIAVAGNTLGGTLTATITDSATGAGDGTVTWNYSVANSATQYLAEGQTASESFTVRITDNNGGYVERVVVVTVTGTNDLPTVTAADLVGALVEDESDPDLIDSGVLTFDDVDLTDTHTTSVTASADNELGGTLNASVSDSATGPGEGTVTWSYSVANGAVQNLAEGETASETFTVRIEDNHGGYVDREVVVTVTGTNDRPVANADSSTTSENASVTVDVLANDTDVDNGAVLTVTAASAPSGQGSASVDGNQVQFDPGTDFDGLAEGETVDVLVSYTIADEHGATSSSSVTITVTGTNDGPVANADTGSTTENAAVTIDILANDTDADNGAVLTVTGASAPVGQGLASVVANQVHFDPGTDFDHLAEGESAEVVISYAIEDEHGAVAHSTLTVTVTGTNDGPVANPDTAATDENGPVLVDVVANDTDADDGAVFTITAASAPAGQGTASVDANQVAFDPGTDFDYLGVGETASVEVSYTIEDEHGATSSSTVSITVTGTNDTPIANAASESVAEDGLFSGSVTATDADGDTVSFSLLDPAPEGLTFNDDGTYSIDAASYDWLYQGQTATYLLAFTATDTNGTTSAPAILSITITGTNDVPVVEAAILDQSVPEDTLWTFTVPAGTFADPDSVLLYSATLGDGSDLPSWLSFDPDTQTFNGTPPVELSGTISLKVTATDGLATASDTFDLTVTAVNDAPVNTLPATFSTNEVTALALNGLQVTDADAGSGTISVQLSVDGGWLTAASAGGVTVTGSGTASLTLSGTLAALNAYLAAAASQPVFNPTGNASGPVNLTMTTNDGGNSGGSAVADTDTSVITVVAVNDAPVNSVPGTQSVQAGVATDIDTFGAWVSDIDSPTLTSTVSVGHGTLSVATGTGATVAGDGSGTVTLSGTQAQINAALDALRYTSASGFSGTDTLTLATTDGALTDTDQVSIQVNGAQAVNIKFVPNGNDYGNTLPSGEVFGTFVAYDANGNVIPGATITSSIVAGGDLSFNNGQLAGDLGNGDVFTFTVTSGSVTETVTIRVGNGTGNAFTGNANIDIMFGVNGSDPLSGGDNDDALYGNDAGDTLNGGENDDFLIGGDAGDTLNGGNGNDYLRGGLGVDTLTGGAGNDLFVFNVTPGTANRDMITDFNASGDPLNGDRILLEDGIFSAFGSTFDAGEFRASVGGTALDGNDFLLFDTSTGNLYYDADGNGAGARQLIAVVTVTSGTIDPADFLLV